MTCEICSRTYPQQSHVGECPHCLPSYRRAVKLIEEGKIWPAFKAINYVPTYKEWECIHSIEVAGAKEKQGLEGRKTGLPALGIPINEAKIDELIAKAEKRTKASANAEIARIVKLHAAQKPTPEQKRAAQQAEQDFYDSTYTS